MKYKIDWDSIISEAIAWFTVLAMIAAITVALYSCSVQVAFTKDNGSADQKSKDDADLSGETLDVLGKDKTRVYNDSIEPIKIVDSLK